MYIHLHGHSTYSFLEAIGRTKNIVGRIEDLGMSAVGITDYRGMYGAFDIYKTCISANIKPLIGVEMPYVRDVNLITRRDQHPGTVCFLAKDYIGYQQLLSLVSVAHAKKKYDVPYIDMALVQQYCNGDHVFFFVGGIRSFLGRMVLEGINVTQITEHFQLFVDHFGVSNVFGEIIAQDYTVLSNLERVNDFVLSASDQLGVSCFVSSDFHYVLPAEKEAYELALCIKDGKKIYEEDRRKVVGDYHIMSGSDVVSIMQKNGFSPGVISAMVDTTQQIADSIDIVIPMGETLFPHYQSDPTLKKLYRQYQDRLVEDG